MSTAARERVAAVESAVHAFVGWLDHFGETSFDHQSYFAGPLGRWAKALYYRRPVLGMVAVAPMIASEALFPAARAFFWRRQRFPIADAHYAMGFAALFRLHGDNHDRERAVHFAEVLAASRCPGYVHAGWGYPFDWVTRTGVMPAQTPLITTTPYCYDAFKCLHEIDSRERWLELMRSAAEHAFTDIKDRPISAESASAGYKPQDGEGGVVNASAYRARMLTDAGLRFSRGDYLATARRNLVYVLDSQQADGSWFYATDGVRNFVDHFHTCFVLKALAGIDALIPDERCRSAIARGVRYYVEHLFDERGRPRPFTRRPRLTVYRHELYDYAECINLATMMHGRFPLLDERLGTTLDDLMANWRKFDGSFRTRRLMFGWDNVPMHRWAQAQLFRSLCRWLLVQPRGFPSMAAEAPAALACPA